MNPHDDNNPPTPRPTPTLSPRSVWYAALLTVASLAGVGCIEHRVKTDPIHITVDVNLRVDEELKEFFAYEDEIERRTLKDTQPPAPISSQQESK